VQSASKELLTGLWDFVDQRRPNWSAALEAGDVVVWDNRALVHRRQGWPEDVERVMWHLTVSGEVPTPMYPPRVVNINALGYDQQGDPDY
jgi:taurine dioxygenase